VTNLAVLSNFFSEKELRTLAADTSDDTKFYTIGSQLHCNLSSNW